MALDFQTSVIDIKGIGPARARLLRKLGIESVSDLLRHFPRDYRDVSKVTAIAEASLGDAVLCVQIRHNAHTFRKKGLTITSAQANDKTGSVTLIWYNQPYMAGNLKQGATLLAIGRLEYRFGELQMANPILESPGSSIIGERWLPVYPLTAGLSQRLMHHAVAACLHDMPKDIFDTLPEEIRQENGLCGLYEALWGIHFPKNAEELAQARKRLVFEELLLFQAAMASVSSRERNERGVPLACSNEKTEELLGKLPYELTNAQKKALIELASDMRKPAPMNRLVQGDVGSGKTALALFVLLWAASEGYQAAMMAPTDILARQHCRTAERFLAPLGIKTALLTASQTQAERSETLERIKTGEIQAVIGTHSLISKGVEYKNLAACVVDEQHRFGVSQRAALLNKGVHPHVMVMSATPIPRTLALILYGDLELSLLDEMPPGRQSIKTYCVPQDKRADMYGFIRKHALSGGQAYVVCPLVEESEALEARSVEQVYDDVAKAMPDVPAGCLHGKMPGKKKDELLQRFEKGEIRVLVSTSVVEVGVDIRNATLMAIESPERFGLAQLHQLRGRVGRGETQSYCFVMLPEGEHAAKGRLEYFAKHLDGFELAEEDLRLRGPGQFLGTRQTGLPDMKAVEFAGNVENVQKTREVLQKLLKGGYGERAGKAVMEAAMSRYGKAFDEIAMN
ncbi:MAG: ATP-dependent DNA helicase RecG [Bacillota bacterium]|nr:ATP-dependent DNA helicase RecG [Bacillota bacterium]